MNAGLDGKIRGDHGAVKGGKANLIEQPGLNGSHIAVGEEGFGVGADQVEVETVEEVVGSVTATGTNDGGDVRIRKSAMQIAEPLLKRTGKIRGVLAGCVLFSDHLVAKLAEGRDAMRNAVGAGVAGRRDDGEARVRGDCWGFEKAIRQGAPRRRR